MSAEQIATALDIFAADPRWVAWRTEDRNGKPTKIPYTASGRLAKSDDPSTWDTFEYCEVKAQSFGGAVGLMLGDIGGDLSLVGIDLDSCLENGILAAWTQPILAAIPSYAEVSPSGKGLKVFFYIESAEVRPFLELNGVHDPKPTGFTRSIPGERSKKDHGPGVEFYASNRFFAVTRKRWSGQPDRVQLLDWDALERLTQVIPAATDAQPTTKTNGQANGKANGHDNSRSAAAWRKGFEAHRAGKSYEEFVDALQADPETSAWVREKGLDSGQRELRRIWDKTGQSEASNGTESKYAELAKLSLDEYDHQRKVAARELGIRPTTLDEMVKAKRKLISVAAAPQPGRELMLRDPQPWSEAVNGVSLLENAVIEIKRYIILEEYEARAIALWVVASHTFRSFKVFPRLFISAADKGCGKTTLLEVVFHLVPRPMMVSNISAAALFRVIEQTWPTLLLDEADSFVKNNEDMRGIIDAGHRFDGNVVRCVDTTDGYEPRQFSVWAPMVLAAIGHLSSTIEDRCVKIRMRRRLADEKVETLRIGRTESLEAIAQQAARWTKDNSERIAAADPVIPKEIINRQADNWYPLFAVADLMGPRWGEYAREVAIKISSRGETSMRELLLTDLQELFNTRLTSELSPTEQLAGPLVPSVLFTKEILEFLNNKDDRPWPEWGKDRAPMTGPQLARMLKPLRVPTGKAVRRGEEIAKGYRREDLEDAFKRYARPSDG